MGVVDSAVALWQRVFGSVDDGELNRSSRAAGVVVRQRKFSAAVLLQTLVLTWLKKPTAANADFVSTAALLGLEITPEAIAKRFTEPLAHWLRQLVDVALAGLFASTRRCETLLDKFSAIYIGDSSTIRLPDELAGTYPGCGGSGGACKAALKIHLLIDYLTGAIVRFVITPARSSDAHGAIAAELPPPGSLSLFDLGYFAFERFCSIRDAGGYWISRLMQGTKTFDATGRQFDLIARLGASGATIFDELIHLGTVERLPCRLIAIKAPPEVAQRRRAKVRDMARKKCRPVSADSLVWQDWTIFITNADAALLTWREVVVLYRGRWQIELVFKLWKSHNGLATSAPGASVQRLLAELWGKLIGVLVQHGALIATTWGNVRCNLRRAAPLLRRLLDRFILALEDASALAAAFETFQVHANRNARNESRRKQPAWFQLVAEPRLLNWGA